MNLQTWQTWIEESQRLLFSRFDLLIVKWQRRSFISLSFIWIEMSVSKTRQFSTTQFERIWRWKIIRKGLLRAITILRSEGRGWCRDGHAIVKRGRAGIAFWPRFSMCLELQRRVRRAVACCSSDSSAFSLLSPSVSLQPVPCHPSLCRTFSFSSLSFSFPRTKAQMAGIDLNPESRSPGKTYPADTYLPTFRYLHAPILT